MSITNTQLIKYCESMLGEAYWWGTYNLTCTQELYNTKKKQYPKYYNQASYKVSFADQIKKKMKCTDCIGLIKGAVWCNGDKNAKPVYNASQDVNVGGMIDKCTKKGDISSLPEVPGVLVFIERHHVGVYAGNGYVLEARGHDYGVVKTKLKGRGWTSWGYCPWITYSSTATKTQTTTTTTTKTTTTTTTKKSVEEVAKDVIAGKYGAGSDRKKKLESEGYNYAEVQAMVNKLSTVRVGCKVKIKSGATTYDGKKVAVWVRLKTYTVDEVKGDRAVLDKKGLCTPFNVKDLIIQ